MRRSAPQMFFRLSNLFAHARISAPDVLPISVGRLAYHRVVGAVAQELPRRLMGDVARVPRRAYVLHYVLGHRVELFVVGLDHRRPVLVERALAHLRLRVVGVHLPEVIGDAAVPGEPYHRVYGLVRGLYRAQAPRVLAHRRGDVRVPLWGRRLVVRPHPGEADAVVQAVVDVVVGAHRVRE